jgi:ATP-dependent protease Clp ATPase subunit
MYDLPSRDDVAKVVIGAEVVLEKTEPIFITRASTPRTNRPRRAAS